MRRRLTGMARRARRSRRSGPALCRHGRGQDAGSTTNSSPRRCRKTQQLKEMEWFINAAKPFKGLEINVLSETIPTHEYEVEDADQGVRGNHRHQGQPPASGRGRSRPGGADADADQPQPLRRLHQRLRPDRHALAPAVGGQPHRLDGGRRQGRDPADARRRRLHRQVVHHRPRRQALAAARPAVRQPLLVPQRLVRPAGAEEAGSRTSTATTSACR